MNSQKELVKQRLEEKLERECGSVMMNALRDPAVIEIMLNPDGKLWVDIAGKGMECTGHSMSPGAAESVLTTCASMLNTVVTRDSPILEGEFPLDGSRLEGIIPPIVRAPTFTIRKKALKVFTLDDYRTKGIIGASLLGSQAASAKPDAQPVHAHPIEAIRHAVRQRHNILIVGGTGSGKTTLANAILAEIAMQCGEDRLVAIEDTMELQIAMPNSVLLRTSEQATMQRLLRATMRLRPDRIVVGEVRGGEALTLLKSWNTGHPGGIATIHANSAEGGLIRLSQLIYEAPEARNLSETSIATMIKEAVNLVVFIERSATPAGRSVSELMQISDFIQGRFVMRSVDLH
ncbi:P-type conjugative transfer ATPase TrbB [Chitinimonas sp. BJB300]|uniref:P-type conjugative transfer ATPase TrbB n=1 Tax=Chitinimonas sp. BJB300 TaxID=1559339 RepID=UPI000C106511|nr:P-type conjugative transfer ATPase TrbB [Chitinimonas sp. BJB300]PHV13505.1 P-type conjugative transfer ATPase TrbB [Chitinimonas sp. BJB300]TSJ89811.1 P-type conjugative transfer ATPase TrbB [Chitinimonas sp. BJB300]